MTTRLAAAILGHRRIFLVAVALLTAILAYHCTQLRVAIRFGDLTPAAHPYMDVHQRYASTFGEANTLFIMLRVLDGTLYTRETLSKLIKLTWEADKLPGVNHDQVSSVAHRMTRGIRIEPGGAIYTEPIMNAPPEDDEEVRAIRDKIEKTPFIIGNLVSLDRRAALIRVGLRENALDPAALFTAVNERIIKAFSDDRHEIFVAGQPRLDGWLLHHQPALRAVFLGSALTIWALLWLYYRNWRGVVLPTVPAALSAIWGFGTLGLLGIPVNPLALVIPFLLTGRALAHGVQMLDRLYEEMQRGANRRSAAVAAFTALLHPTGWGLATDVLGALLILFVPIGILRETGAMAAFWLASLVITELFLNLVLFDAAAPPTSALRLRPVAPGSAAVGRLGAAAARHPLAALAAGALLFVAGNLGMRGLRIGDPASASSLVRPTHPYNLAHREIQAQFGGVEPLIVVAEGKRPDAIKPPAVLRTLEEFQRVMERDPLVGASFSPADIIRSVGMTVHELEPKWGVLPLTDQDSATLFFFFWAGQPPKAIERYMTPDFSATHVTFFCRDHAEPNVRRIVARAQEFIDTHPLPTVRLRLGGGMIGVLGAAYEEIRHRQPLLTVGAFVLTGLAVLLAFRSLRATVALLLPLAVAHVLVGAYMRLRGIGIDVQTLPVIAVGVAFGVDGGIYVLSRLRTAPPALAVGAAGTPVLFSALALATGTIPWLLSAIRFQSELGALAALWTVAAAVGSVVLVPAAWAVGRRSSLPRPSGRSPSHQG